MSDETTQDMEAAISPPRRKRAYRKPDRTGLPVPPEHVHRWGAPALGCGSRPTKPYAIRLNAAERAKLEASVDRYQENASVLIREAMQAFGLI